MTVRIEQLEDQELKDEAQYLTRAAHDGHDPANSYAGTLLDDVIVELERRGFVVRQTSEHRIMIENPTSESTRRFWNEIHGITIG